MDMLNFYLILGAVLFSLGVFGVLLRRDAIVVLMCIELMLNAVNLTFVALSTKFGTLDGQVYVLFIMSVAAAEVAVGLAIVLTIFRNFRSIDTGKVVTLRG